VTGPARLALSNIAWAPEDEPAAAALLAARGVTAVEVAPTSRWPDPRRSTAAQRRAWRDWWGEQGIEIVAMQALLFGRDDLQLFGPAAGRRELLDYLAEVLAVGADLGARVAVFGAPKNRRLQGTPPAEAERIAVEFFRELAERALATGVLVGLEANPTGYGCDFITTSAEARALVQLVDRPGLVLHLDLGGMTLAGEDLPSAIGACSGMIRHVHVSEPGLAPLGTGATAHAAAAAALRQARYGGVLSVEMRRPPPGESDRLSALRRALDVLQSVYGADAA